MGTNGSTYDGIDPDTEITLPANGQRVEPERFGLGGVRTVPEANQGDNSYIEISPPESSASSEKLASP